MSFRSQRPLSPCDARRVAALVRVLPALLVAGVVGAALGLAAGCGDRSRQLGEGEALQYKRQLVLGGRGQLSEEQAVRLMADPARTRAGLDAAFARSREAAAAEAAAERARLRAARSPGGRSAKAAAGRAASATPEPPEEAAERAVEGEGAGEREGATPPGGHVDPDR